MRVQQVKFVVMWGSCKRVQGNCRRVCVVKWPLGRRGDAKYAIDGSQSRTLIATCQGGVQEGAQEWHKQKVHGKKSGPRTCRLWAVKRPRGSTNGRLCPMRCAALRGSHVSVFDVCRLDNPFFGR